MLKNGLRFLKMQKKKRIAFFKNAKETDPFFEKRNPEKIRKKNGNFKKNFKMLKNGLRFLKMQNKKNGLRFLKTQKKRIRFLKNGIRKKYGKKTEISKTILKC